MEDMLISGGLYLSYMLLAIGVLASFIFPIIQMIKNPKSTIGSIGGIIIIALIFSVGYALSSDEAITKFEANYKMVGAWIITTYVLGTGVILAAIYAEISNLFK